MECYPVEEFYDDARRRPLTAPSHAMARRAQYPADAHLHGSYAHCHTGSHVPHKHVIADAGLCKPEQLAQQQAIPVEKPRRQRLAKSA